MLAEEDTLLYDIIYRLVARLSLLLHTTLNSGNFGEVFI